MGRSCEDFWKLWAVCKMAFECFVCRGLGMFGEKFLKCDGCCIQQYKESKKKGGGVL